MGVLPSTFGRSKMVWVILAVAIFLAVSCGGGAETSAPTSTGATIPASAITTVLGQSSESEQSFLEDGVITFQEYEEAFFNMLRCLEEAGVPVHDVKITPRQRYEYKTVLPTPGPDVDINKYLSERLETTTRCQTQHFNHVQRLWNRYTDPTQAEVDEVVKQVLACMREQGADIPATASREDIFNFFTSAGGQAVYAPSGTAWSILKSAWGREWSSASGESNRPKQH